MKLQRHSMLTCPVCQHQCLMHMPLVNWVSAFVCENCSSSIKVMPGVCCVFCSYGSVGCPASQGWQQLKSRLDKEKEDRSQLPISENH
ncbi:MAG: GDCCVxC domain-containing (seleno)protein [Cyclobacteriaceae bacterium]